MKKLYNNEMKTNRSLIGKFCNKQFSKIKNN